MKMKNSVLVTKWGKGLKSVYFICALMFIHNYACIKFWSHDLLPPVTWAPLKVPIIFQFDSFHFVPCCWTAAVSVWPCLQIDILYFICALMFIHNYACIKFWSHDLLPPVTWAPLKVPIIFQFDSFHFVPCCWTAAVSVWPCLQIDILYE